MDLELESDKTALEYGIEITKKLWMGNGQRMPGTSVCEFGVYKGHTLQKIVDSFSSLHSVFRPCIFGFDSFLGLPHDWEHTANKAGTFSTHGELPRVEGATLVAGWFDETVPEWAEHNGVPISLLHLDADLYSSTRTILWELNHLIVQNTVIVCDEWTYNAHEKRDDEEQRAFREWLIEYNRSVIKVDYVDPTFDGWHVGAERAIFIVLE